MRLWQQVEEVGGPLAMRMTFILLKTLPYALLVLIAIPVSFFYWVIDGKGRKAVASYLESIDRINGKKYHSYPLFLSFAISIVEKGKSWIGSIDERNLIFSDDDISQFDKDLKEGKGAIAIVSHLGSTEELRALSSRIMDSNLGHQIPILCIVDFDGTEQFSKLLTTLNPGSMLNIMGIRTMGIESMGRITDTLESGGLVIIAGDRAGERNMSIDFLGRNARFPLGAFLIPALTAVPCYFMFCLRQKDIGLSKKREIHVHRNPAVLMGNSRKDRMEYAEASAVSFSGFLAHYTLLHPYQWFNFFEFWSNHD